MIDTVFARIQEIVILSLKALQPKILHPASSQYFQFCGFDILLDKDLNPYLLEINTNPGMKTNSKTDYELKYWLVDDIMTILDYERR